MKGELARYSIFDGVIEGLEEHGVIDYWLLRY
jgi:hypothetical protein